MPTPSPSEPDLHLYDQDRRWVAGGTVLPGLTRPEALQRVAATVATMPPDSDDDEVRMHDRAGGRPHYYRWSGQTGEMKSLPAPTPGVEPGPVYDVDARDLHLLGPDQGRGKFGHRV